MRVNHRVPADSMTPDSLARHRAGLDALHAEAYQVSDRLSLLCVVLVVGVILALAFWPEWTGWLTEFGWGVLVGVWGTLAIVGGLLFLGAMIGEPRQRAQWTHRSCAKRIDRP